MTQEELDCTPICEGHFDAWMTSRNHIQSASETGCILCDLQIANKALLILAGVNRRSGTPAEQVADWKAHAKAKLDAEHQVLTIEVTRD